jgi:hypothetical protein
VFLKELIKWSKNLTGHLVKGDVKIEKQIPTLYGRNLFFAQSVVRQGGQKIIVLKVGQGDFVVDIWLEKNGANLLRQFLEETVID